MRFIKRVQLKSTLVNDNNSSSPTPSTSASSSQTFIAFEPAESVQAYPTNNILENGSSTVVKSLSIYLLNLSYHLLPEIFLRTFIQQAAEESDKIHAVSYLGLL